MLNQMFFMLRSLSFSLRSVNTNMVFGRIGDYYRYQANLLGVDCRVAFGIQGNGSYRKAARIGDRHLPPSNPTRIFCALSRSPLYDGTLHLSFTGLATVSTAFKYAIEDVQNIP